MIGEQSDKIICVKVKKKEYKMMFTCNNLHEEKLIHELHLNFKNQTIISNLSNFNSIFCTHSYIKNYLWIGYFLRKNFGNISF